MKKSILLAALLPMMALGLNSCTDDTQPRLQPAEAGSFKLYEPALNNYTYYLNQEGTLTLTTSGQPDYGVATPTEYEVQVSYEADDTKWVDAVENENGDVITPANYYVLQTINTQSVISVKMRELAVAMCSLMGISSADDEGLFDPNPRPVYVRVRAYVLDPAAEKGFVDYTEIYSNVIKLNSVQPYFVVPAPAEIYIIGNYQDWKIDGNELTVTLSEAENGIGSNIFTGYVNMTADQASSGFRFYTELGDWGKDGDLPSIGAAAADGDNVDVKMKDGEAEVECVKGKGNFKVQDFEGGWMKITVNMNNMTVLFQAAPDYVPAQ